MLKKRLKLLYAIWGPKSRVNLKRLRIKCKMKKLNFFSLKGLLHTGTPLRKFQFGMGYFSKGETAIKSVFKSLPYKINKLTYLNKF